MRQAIARHVFPRHMTRHLALGAGLLVLAACGRTDQRKAVDLLHQRLHTQLADAVQARSVTVEDRRDGAVVTFPDAAPDTGPDPRTAMVEALLDPALLRIGIAAPAGLPPYEADRRVQAWANDFSRMQIGSALQPPATMPQPAPNGMTVAIQVVCPDRPNGWGIGAGRRDPACF